MGCDFGPDVKKAGFDHIINKNRSPDPVMMVIREGEIEFREARHLLGMTVSEKTAAIRHELNDKLYTLLYIDPACENLVKIFLVMSEDRAAG